MARSASVRCIEGLGRNPGIKRGRPYSSGFAHVGRRELALPWWEGTMGCEARKRGTAPRQSVVRWIDVLLEPAYRLT